MDSTVRYILGSGEMGWRSCSVENAIAAAVLYVSIRELEEVPYLVMPHSHTYTLTHTLSVPPSRASSSNQHYKSTLVCRKQREKLLWCTVY